MDIPELLRQLLELKYRLDDKYSMNIMITANNTLRVRFWMSHGDQRACEMPLTSWSTMSRDFLNDCLGIARYHNLLDKQGVLEL